MPIAISETCPLSAFAIIVDINNFGRMVTDATAGVTKGEHIAHFTRDILENAINAIETHEGEVVGVMGDAVFGVVPEGPAISAVCEEIAGTVNRECRHISEQQFDSPISWHYSPGGPSLKICIEFGSMRITTIRTRHLGMQHLIIGPAVNHASRIGQAGAGNRCLLGPTAAGMAEFSSKPLLGPMHTGGKGGEPDLIYYELSLANLWQEGSRKSDQSSYLH